MELLNKLKSQQALSAIAKQAELAKVEADQSIEPEGVDNDTLIQSLENTCNNVTAIGLQVQQLGIQLEDAQYRIQYLENLIGAILATQPEITKKLNDKLKEIKSTESVSNETASIR